MDFKSFREQRLKGPAFREAYEESQPAYTIARAMIETRIKADLTQKELSARSGIALSDIEEYENGNGDPSLHTLQRLAKAMGKRIHVTFEESELEQSATCTKIEQVQQEGSRSNFNSTT